MTTQKHLWLVIDHTPDLTRRRPRELVICGPELRPNDVMNVPLMYAENVYIGEQDDNPVYAWTETDAGIWQEQERNQRRMRRTE